MTIRRIHYSITRRLNVSVSVTSQPDRNRGRTSTLRNATSQVDSAIPTPLTESVSRDETSAQSGVILLDKSVQTSKKEEDRGVVASSTPRNNSALPGPATTCRSNSEARDKSSWFSSKVNTAVPVFLNRVNRSVTGVAMQWWLVRCRFHHQVNHFLLNGIV